MGPDLDIFKKSNENLKINNTKKMIFFAFTLVLMELQMDYQ